MADYIACNKKDGVITSIDFDLYGNLETISIGTELIIDTIEAVVVGFDSMGDQIIIKFNNVVSLTVAKIRRLMINRRLSLNPTKYNNINESDDGYIPLPKIAPLISKNIIQ